MKYKVIAKVSSDERGKKGSENYQEKMIYPPGEILSGDEFPKKIIKNWVEIGVLAEISEVKRSKEEEVNLDDLFEITTDELDTEDGE